MADLVLTVASVVKGATALLGHGIAGGTITAGQPVYKDTSDLNDLKAGDSDAAASALLFGIALHGALDKQPLTVIIAGPITIGATIVLGETYILSDTAGGIVPVGDIGSGEFTTVIGVATSTTVLTVNLIISGVQRA